MSEMKNWRLSVKVSREIRPVGPGVVCITLPGQAEVGMVVDEWVLCDFPGPSALFARDLFWKNIKHRCPARLNFQGRPVAVRRLKKHEIIVREVTAEDMPLGDGEEYQPKQIRCPHCGNVLLWGEDRGAHCDGCDDFDQESDLPAIEAHVQAEPAPRMSIADAVSSALKK